MALLVFRTLQGLGLGGEVPVAATYISELSKAKERGKFVLFYELVFPFGLLGAALAGYWIVPHWGWRPLFVLGGLAALLIFYLRSRLPESPRWLASVGRINEAEEAMTCIEKRVERSSGIALPPPEARVVVGATGQTRWRELLESPYRGRTLVVWVLWFSAYLTTYGLTTWLPSIYTSVYHLPLQRAFGYSLGTTAAGLVGALVCALLIDRLGRRFWLAGALMMAGVFLGVLWLLGRPTALDVLLWSALAYLFTSSVSLAVYLYTPELYPTRMRALGSSIASAWARLASITGPLLVGVLLARYSLAWVFLVFGAVCLMGGVTTALFSTETRERLLEEVSP